MRRWLFIILLHTIARLPWRGIQTLGQLVGKALIRWPNRQYRDALINIRLCFPDWSAAEQQALCHASLLEFGKTFVELAALWTWPSARVLNLIQGVTGSEWLQRVPGEGLIALTPHLGAWELAGLYMAARGGITSLYRPQNTADDWILAARQRNGAVLVPDDIRGVKHLLKTVKAGGQIGILPDQVTRELTGAIFAPFFKVPAATMLLVAGLARRSQARVVFVVARRLSNHQGFHLHCIPAPLTIADDNDLIAATALNAGVEQCIRLCPEQYQWTYRRFRRRPELLSSPYHGPLRP